MTEWFDNGDGLLAFHNPEEAQTSKENLIVLKILLTDSGHYILPIDSDTNVAEDDQHGKVVLFMQHVFQKSNDQWTDVHPKIKALFCQQTNEGSSRVKPEQSEEHHEGHSKDHWRIEENSNKLIRDHVRPRLALFFPQLDRSPIAIANISKKRHTKIFYRNGSSEQRNDEWQDDQHQDLLHDRWTGETIFEIVPSSPEHHTIHDEDDKIFFEGEIAD